MLAEAWFAIVALMLAVYVMLDGFDLGVGVLHLFVAKTDAERRQVLASVGPVWDGNEVWLIAGGATLFMAFPTLFALAFSGFYLPLMIVLWLLMFRALGIELRHQFSHPIWNQIWDVAFAVSSGALVIAYGAALGGVVRGVSMTEEGTFFAPLWTDFGVFGFAPDHVAGVLDWYTVSVGLCALLVLTMHGALWLSARTTGEVRKRSEALAKKTILGAAIALLVLSLLTAKVQPHLLENIKERPLGLLFPLIGIAAHVLSYKWIGTRKAFRASCMLIVCLMASAAYAVYPNVLPAMVPERSLTLYDAATSEYGMAVALTWFIPGMCLVTGYFAWLYASMPERYELPAEDDAH